MSYWLPIPLAALFTLKRSFAICKSEVAFTTAESVRSLSLTISEAMFQRLD
jgi:hypothetical protein